jgi:hypothetical protein
VSREQRVILMFFAVLAFGFAYFFVAPSCPRAVSTQEEAKSFFHSEVGDDPHGQLVAVDRGTYWEVYQTHKPPLAVGQGTKEIVTAIKSGGQPEAQIDKCGGRASIMSYYR